MSETVVKNSNSGAKIRSASGALHQTASDSNGSGIFNSSGASSRKIAKDSFSVDEIIRCFESCMLPPDRLGASPGVLFYIMIQK